MPKELEVGRCGLDFNNANLPYYDSKNFGPRKYQLNKAEVFCDVTACPLTQGVEIRFPTIPAATREELNSIFVEEARTQESIISEQLLKTRLTQCPYLKNQLGKNANG